MLISRLGIPRRWIMQSYPSAARGPGPPSGQPQGVRRVAAHQGAPENAVGVAGCCHTHRVDAGRTGHRAVAGRHVLCERDDPERPGVRLLMLRRHTCCMCDCRPATTLWVPRFDTLLENVSDPSHVPFAHHGYQGNREKAAPIPINVISNTLSGWKAVCPGVTSTSGHPATWELRFQPPCLLTFDFTMRPAPKGRKAEERAAKGQPPPAQRIGLVAYCVPISPGRCRLIFHSPRNFLTNINPPRWYLHMVNNAILDGDSIFLHMQERYLRQDAQGRDSPAEAGKFLEKCYMPASSDAALIEGRKWLKRFGGGGPKWLRGKDELPPLLSRELALDRYKQHVLLCSSCSGALRNVRVLQRVLAAAAGLQVVAAALTSAISQRLSMLWAASAIAFATIAWLLKEKMEPSFLFKDYVHAHR
eukprot:jgi/Mesvir1/26837/Mv20592-RA.1